MATPEISVVMSVYNDAARVGVTLDSVLEQTGVDFELIVVDDGSSDGTATVLTAYQAQDARVRVIRQENQGITKALIMGCAAARGFYIARQDSGDLSLPGRLTAQRNRLHQQPGAVLSVTGVREFLHDVPNLHEIKPDPDDAVLTRNLREQLVGVPAHGCVMFCRTAYEQAGGYREAFYYAQDRDLWLRLVELGSVVGTPEALYALNAAIGGISTHRSSTQARLSMLATEAHRVRQQGGDELEVLNCAVRLSARAKAMRSSKPDNYELAGAFCRLGTRVASMDAEKARYYFKESFRRCPYYWRSWLKLL